MRFLLIPNHPDSLNDLSPFYDPSLFKQLHKRSQRHRV